MGFRSLRVIGQRYRLVYSIDRDSRRVHAVAAGLRREGGRDDIYELARRVVRLGLFPPSRKPGPRPGKSRGRKKK